MSRVHVSVGGGGPPITCQNGRLVPTNNTCTVEQRICMAITSSFVDLGVVLNAPTSKREGLITCIGHYLHLFHAHLGLSHVILINAYM